MKESKNYKPNEFAKITGVSVKTLQKWDREGKLVAYRTPSGRRYYTEKHVVEFNRSIPEEAKIKNLYMLHLWLAPYPLKCLMNAGISGIEKIGDHIARAIVKSRRASASTWFSLYADCADKHVTLAPVTIGSDTWIHDAVLFRIETPKADKELLACENVLTPSFVETDENTFWFGINSDIGITDILARLFWAFEDDKMPLAKFIWMEPGTITVCLDNIFRKETVRETISAFDKYLECHSDIGTILLDL